MDFEVISDRKRHKARLADHVDVQDEVEDEPEVPAAIALPGLKHVACRSVIETSKTCHFRPFELRSHPFPWSLDLHLGLESSRFNAKWQRRRSG